MNWKQNTIMSIKPTPINFEEHDTNRAKFLEDSIAKLYKDMTIIISSFDERLKCLETQADKNTKAIKELYEVLNE